MNEKIYKEGLAQIEKVFPYNKDCRNQERIGYQREGFRECLDWLSNKNQKENNGWKTIIDPLEVPYDDVWVCNINGNKKAFHHDALKPFPKNATHYKSIEKPQPPIF